MNKNRIGNLILCLTAVMALFAFSAMPALAGDDNNGQDKKEEQNFQESDQAASDNDGDADSDSSTAYNEDNDTNDGGTPNNVSDDGDNAHPSGKDRSVENGGSGTQGKSESNPDDSKGPQRYEGARGDDKANGPGGTDLADQDGNNGCGNDDDFDDDNNGWCGKARTSDDDGGGSTGGGSTPPSSGCPNDKMGGDDTGHGANQGSAYDSTCDGSPSGNGNGGGNANGKTCAGCVGNADDKNPPGQYPDGTDHNNGYECDGNHGVGRTNPAHTGCRTSTPPSSVCPAGTDMAGQPPTSTGCNLPANVVCPAGTEMAGLPPGTSGCNPSVTATGELCPAGTDYAGFPMSDLVDCNTGGVLGRTDGVNPLELCPSGPFKGMPMVNASDCAGPGDRVLPKVIHNESNPIADVAGRVAGAIGKVGAVLPFTGAGDLYFAVALGLLLIAAGVAGLKLRNNS